VRRRVWFRGTREDAVQAPLGRSVGGEIVLQARFEPLGILVAVGGQLLDPDLPAATEVADCRGQAVVTVVGRIAAETAHTCFSQIIHRVIDTGRRILERAEVDAETVTP
jgi:hypothetical protein